MATGAPHAPTESDDLSNADRLDVKLMTLATNLGDRKRITAIMACERLVGLMDAHDTGDDQLSRRLKVGAAKTRVRPLRDALIRACRPSDYAKGQNYVAKLCRDYRKLVVLGPVVLEQITDPAVVASGFWRLQAMLRALNDTEERTFWSDPTRQTALAELIRTAPEWALASATNAEFYDTLRSRASGTPALPDAPSLLGVTSRAPPATVLPQKTAPKRQRSQGAKKKKGPKAVKWPSPSQPTIAFRNQKATDPEPLTTTKTVADTVAVGLPIPVRTTPALTHPKTCETQLTAEVEAPPVLQTQRAGPSETRATQRPTRSTAPAAPCEVAPAATLTDPPTKQARVCRRLWADHPQQTASDAPPPVAKRRKTSAPKPRQTTRPQTRTRPAPKLTPAPRLPPTPGPSVPGTNICTRLSGEACDEWVNAVSALGFPVDQPTAGGFREAFTVWAQADGFGDQTQNHCTQLRALCVTLCQKMGRASAEAKKTRTLLSNSVLREAFRETRASYGGRA